jgi:hypothetical protein
MPIPIHRDDTSALPLSQVPQLSTLVSTIRQNHQIASQFRVDEVQATR